MQLSVKTCNRQLRAQYYTLQFSSHLIFLFFYSFMVDCILKIILNIKVLLEVFEISYSQCNYNLCIPLSGEQI